MAFPFNLFNLSLSPTDPAEMKLRVFVISFGLAITVQSQSVETFWNDYPDCERQCHQSVYISQSCTLQNSCSCSGCLCLADSCLCETSSWLIAVSQCVGQQCGALAVSEAAGIANKACNGNGYPLAVNEQDLIAAGLAAVLPTSVVVNPQASTGSGECLDVLSSFSRS